MQFENLLLAKADGIATITINRPASRNALDKATWNELSQAIRDVAVDDAVSVVIVTGSGDKVFAAGADIKWLQQRPSMDVLGYGGQDVLWNLEHLPKPVIAAVNGFALGGGCELAMACDIRVAADTAKFGQPEVNLGVLPGAGGTQRLARLVGLGKAKELIFTGDIIDAQTAEKIGLVNKVVDQADLMPAVMAIAQKIIAKGPVAVRLSKTAIDIGMSTDLYTGMAYEKLAQAFLFTTEDRKEGTTAFIEKRPPRFSGR